MDCFSRRCLFLALCLSLIGIWASGTEGHALRSSTNNFLSAPSEDYGNEIDGAVSFNQRSAREQFDEVLEELRKHPKYIEAKERNDREAEQRWRRIGSWMRKHPGHIPTSALDKPSDETRARYEEVLKQMPQHPLYIKAQQGTGKGAEERRPTPGEWSIGEPTATRKRPYGGEKWGAMLAEMRGSEKFKKARKSDDGEEEEGPSSYLEQEPKLHVVPAEG